METPKCCNKEMVLIDQDFMDMNVNDFKRYICTECFQICEIKWSSEDDEVLLQILGIDEDLVQDLEEEEYNKVLREKIKENNNYFKPKCKGCQTTLNSEGLCDKCDSQAIR